MNGLDVSDLAPEPIGQLRAWLQTALDADVPEPTAMTLATVDERGRPSARTVLLKGLDERGLVFYTSYRSRKGRELAANPHAAIVLLWAPLQRQVRVRGPVSRTSAEESDAYFATRPPGSRLSAVASPQSEVIPDRATLEARVAQARARHPDTVPRPEHWGGYRVAVAEAEFWQARPDRLHDRLRYSPTPDGGWRIERLAP